MSSLHEASLFFFGFSLSHSYASLSVCFFLPYSCICSSLMMTFPLALLGARVVSSLLSLSLSLGHFSAWGLRMFLNLVLSCSFHDPYKYKWKLRVHVQMKWFKADYQSGCHSVALQPVRAIQLAKSSARKRADSSCIGPENTSSLRHVMSALRLDIVLQRAIHRSLSL